MPFLDHLEELRGRILRCLIAVGVGLVGSYAFADRLFAWLMQPVLRALPEGASRLHFTSGIEPFLVHLKVAFYAGLFFATPVVLYQLWGFVRPGLHTGERRGALAFVLGGTILFLSGAAFCHTIVLPNAFRVLLAMGGEVASPMLTMREQLSLVTALMLSFGLAFELPLLMVLLSAAGIVAPATLARHRRVAVVGCVLAAAVLTPTGDPFNLALLAVPMILFYELGVWAARLFANPPLPRDAAAVVRRTRDFERDRGGEP